MADLKTYDNLDIEKYLQQKMSPQEMHAFEKALMDDPFLADALEGYLASDLALANEHLQLIERELTDDKQKAKVVPLPARKKMGWKVAAILIVLITGGALFYSLTRNSTSEKSLTEKTVETQETILPPVDSVGPVNKDLARNTVPLSKTFLKEKKSLSPIIAPADSQLIASASPAASNPASNLSKDEEVLMLRPIPAAPQTTENFNDANRISMAPPTPQNEFKGQVLSKMGEPVPFATIRIPNTNKGTVTDAKGSFTLKASDSIIQVNVHSTGYDSAITKIKSKESTNKVFLKESNLSLADMVVMGYSSQKKERQEKAKTELSGEAEPIGGWKNFEQYLNRSVDSLKADDNIKSTEDISLEFMIDEEGKPSNIKVREKTDKELADKAIQILKKGPKWLGNNKDKKVKLVINF